MLYEMSVRRSSFSGFLGAFVLLRVGYNAQRISLQPATLPSCSHFTPNLVTVSTYVEAGADCPMSLVGAKKETTSLPDRQGVPRVPVKTSAVLR